MTLFLRKSATASSKNIENAHIDSRSPGYVARVIRYNEEHEHLPIYEYKENHKLGSSSVGQAAKNDLSSHLKRVSSSNSRINLPKSPKFGSTDYNRILLESITQTSPEKRSDSYNEVNTKNVLEALKEISRKRIHSPEHEKIVLKEDQGNSEIWSNDINIRKKMKFNHPQPKSSVSKEYNTRSCLDELKASHTSMDRQSVVVEHSKKEQWTENMKQSPIAKESTHAKLVDVETQTIPVAEPPKKQKKTLSEPKEVPKQNLIATSTTSTKHAHRIKKMSPVKIFDETPLEAMRKNRLTVLMGSFTEKKTDQHKKPDENAGSEATEKPLISILTKTGKDLTKTSKHVTFNIPPTESSNSVNMSTSSQFSTTFFKDLNTTKTNNEKDMITKTSTALITPIVSSSVVETSPLKNIQTYDGNNNQFSAQSTGQNHLNLSGAQTVSSSNSTSFSITSNSQSPAQNLLGKSEENFSAVPTATKSFFTSLTNSVTGSTSSSSTPSNFTNQNATVEPFRLPSTTVNLVTQNSLGNFNPPACNSSTNITNKTQVFSFSANNLTTPFAQNSAPTIKPSFSSSSATPALNIPSSKPTETKSFSSNLTFATPPSLSNIHKTAPFGKTTSSAFNSNDASPGLSTFARPQFSITTTPVSVSNSPGAINTPAVTSSNNLFMNTNSFAQSPPAFTGFFDKTQGSGFNTNSSTPTFNNSFSQPTTTSGFTSGTGGNQSNNPLFPPFSTGNSSTGGSGFQLNSFQNTNTSGSGPFPSGLTTSPPNVFTFGANNKSTFSFGSNELPKQLFNFNSSSASTPTFDTTNRNVGVAFNSPGTAQFNSQPPAPTIFNIGSGTSMPTRPRSQLKAKRRT